MKMIISEKMKTALDRQIGHEFGAMLQYVSIASYFAAESLPELTAKFYRQADEERQHGLRFVKFLLDAGGRPAIPAIPGPKTQFGSAAEAVEQSVVWERTVTKQITDLVDLARSENDHITENFLAWFLTEQLEEMASMETLLRMVQRAGEERLMQVEAYLAGPHMKKEPAGPAQV